MSLLRFSGLFYLFENFYIDNDVICTHRQWYSFFLNCFSFLFILTITTKFLMCFKKLNSPRLKEKNHWFSSLNTILRPTLLFHCICFLDNLHLLTKFFIPRFLINFVRNWQWNASKNFLSYRYFLFYIL